MPDRPHIYRKLRALRRARGIRGRFQPRWISASWREHQTTWSVNRYPIRAAELAARIGGNGSGSRLGLHRDFAAEFVRRFGGHWSK